MDIVDFHRIAMTDTITLRRPDDWHVHLRDGDMLRAVLPATARQFARAIVMPNLVPPVIDVAAARAYRGRILAALPPGADFTPLMTCYLTDATAPGDVERGVAEGVFAAVKLYPAHATTHSAHGVTDIDRVMPVLERMAALGMQLLVHGEVTDPEVDIFDREAVFIERVLDPLRRRLPELRIVLEHITTEEAVAYVGAGGPNLAATITAHHLVINRNAIFAGGIRPHLYCLPIAKREKHRRALRHAATSGDPGFFLGTDSAPHALPDQGDRVRLRRHLHRALRAGNLRRGVRGGSCARPVRGVCVAERPRFYGLPLNEARVTLRREAWTVPERVGTGDLAVAPFRAGETLRWRLAG